MSRPLLLASLASLLALASCRPTKLDGTAIGQYELRGTLTENTCAEGYPAPAELWFHVELRHRAGSTIGYWKLSDAPIADGTMDRGAGTFRFVDRQEVLAIESQPGVTGCVLERLETVEGTFTSAAADAGPLADGGGPNEADGGGDPRGDASAPIGAPSDAGARDPEEARFVGTTTVGVSPMAGSDCSPLLDPSRGGFPLLPCSIRYAIHGDRLAHDLW